MTHFFEKFTCTSCKMYHNRKKGEMDTDMAKYKSNAAVKAEFNSLQQSFNRANDENSLDLVYTQEMTIETIHIMSTRNY